DNAVPETFRHTTRTDAHRAEDGACLPEVGMVGVQYKRIGLWKCIKENLLVRLVPLVRCSGKGFQEGVVFQVVIEREIGIVPDLEIRFLIAGFVPSEVLGADRRTRERIEYHS